MTQNEELMLASFPSEFEMIDVSTQNPWYQFILFFLYNFILWDISFLFNIKIIIVVVQIFTFNLLTVGGWERSMMA